MGYFPGPWLPDLDLNCTSEARQPLKFPEQMKKIKYFPDSKELYFSKMKLVSVSGLVYIRSYLHFLTQILLKNIFKYPYDFVELGL